MMMIISLSRMSFRAIETALFGNYGIAHDVSATGLTVGRITMNIVPGTTVVNGTVVDGTPVRTWFYRTSILAPWTALQVTAITWQ